MLINNAIIEKECLYWIELESLRNLRLRERNNIVLTNESPATFVKYAETSLSKEEIVKLMIRFGGVVFRLSHKCVKIHENKIT